MAFHPVFNVSRDRPPVRILNYDYNRHDKCKFADPRPSGADPCENGENAHD